MAASAATPLRSTRRCQVDKVRTFRFLLTHSVSAAAAAAVTVGPAGGPSWGVAAAAVLVVNGAAVPDAASAVGLQINWR